MAAAATVWWLVVVVPVVGALVDTNMLVTIEERLLALAEEEHSLQRQRQIEAEGRAGDLAERIDALLAADAPDVDRVHELDTSLALAESLARQAAEGARQARVRIVEQLQRLAVLAELSREAPRATMADPLAGTWRVHVLPLGQEGLFELTVDGTLVSGTYRLDGGYRGSLRGTLVGGTVRLDRIDAEGGFDVVYEGRLDPAAGRIVGHWRGTLLNAPGPSGGDWVADKAADP